MAMVSDLDLLRRVPLFSLLTDEQAEFLGSAITKKRFRRGDVLVERGERSSGLYVLISGKARVLAADERGREVIFTSLVAGDPVGEMSLIDGQPHSATVVADVQTDALLLDRQAFLRCLPAEGSVAYSVMMGLVHRLRHADRTIESLALMDVYGRVSRLLIDSATPASGGDGVMAKKISRQDIARMIGASREMVSRVMKHLESRGFLETLEDGSMRVHPDRLDHLEAHGALEGAVDEA